MKKTNARKSGKGKQTIHMCCDRILTGAEKVKAMEAAFKVNGRNRPPPVSTARKLFGASSMAAPAKMALEAGKKWSVGQIWACTSWTVPPLKKRA